MIVDRIRQLVTTGPDDDRDGRDARVADDQADTEPLEIYEDQDDEDKDDEDTVDDRAGLYEENTLHYHCSNCSEVFVQSEQENCIRCGRPIE